MLMKEMGLLRKDLYFSGGIMMKVAVLGAGCQGFPCVILLMQLSIVESIVLVDVNDSRLKKAKNMYHDNNKLKIIQANFRVKEEREQVIRFVDICIDMLIPDFTADVMATCLAYNVHYINTAYDSPFWENIRNGLPLPFDKEFKKKGLKALLGWGNSPGLVNVFIRKYFDLFDEVYDIDIFGAYSNHERKLIEGWNPGWSIRQAYTDFITPPCIFIEGKYEFKSPFFDVIDMEFPIFGNKRMALHSHEEVYSIPYNLGKGLKRCSFYYEVDEIASIFYSCGFRKDYSIMINGKEIAPIDILFDVLENNQIGIKKDISEYCTLLQFTGLQDGDYVKLRVLLPPISGMNGMDNVSFDVALPVIVGLECLPNIGTGIIFPENINPDLFIGTLKKHISYEEVYLNGKST